MKIIKESRGRGKTTQIIKLAAIDFAYIVCLNKEEVSRVAKQAKEMSLNIPFPITFREFKDDNRSLERRYIVIDNFDYYIENEIEAFVDELKYKLSRLPSLKGFSFSEDKFNIIEKYFIKKESNIKI